MTAQNKPYRTIDVARAAGVTVSTVRTYEEWGFLPPVPRAANGYRQFSYRHILHMKMVRAVMRITWMGGHVRRTALDVLLSAAADDLDGALAHAHTLQDKIIFEQDRAEDALAVVERWAGKTALVDAGKPMRIGQIAAWLNVSVDILRGWEADGLLEVPRLPNGYRIYGVTEQDRLLVIRTLRAARYGTMSVRRMLAHLDAGGGEAPRVVLDTPNPQDDLGHATDHYLSALADVRAACTEILALLAAIWDEI